MVETGFVFFFFFFTIADIVSMSHFKYQHNIATNAKTFWYIHYQKRFKSGVYIHAKCR